MGKAKEWVRHMHHVLSPSHSHQAPPGRGWVRWVRAVDRLFWGHIGIVDLSSIYRRFSGPLDCRYIDDISTAFELNVTVYLSRRVYSRAQGAHALRAAI